MKSIYICHQFYDISHFEALYMYAEEFDYKIVDYIVLDKKNIISKMWKAIIIEREFISSIRECIRSLRKLSKLKKMSNQIIIAGIAPYDYLLNKYGDVFKNNQTFYFTSWQYWTKEIYVRGDYSNKKMYEETLRSSFKGIACVSKATKKQMEKFSNNTVIVNHSIDVKSYVNKKSTERKRKYIYIGRFEEIKNISCILDWLKENKGISIHICFAGSGSLQETLQKYTNEDKRISLLGQISKDEIKETLHEYDYLLLPSKAEPFGIVLLEAMAAGVPCIVSNALGPREIIIDKVNGIMFSLDDKCGFDQAIRDSIHMSNDKYADMVECCKKESIKYDCENIILKWVELIQSGLS